MDDPTIGIAFLYCTFKNQEYQTAERLLASVLRQLVSSRIPFPASTRKLYDQHKTNQTESSQQQLEDAIEAVASLYSEVYVVIDAIDECQLSSVQQFLDALFRLQANCNMNIFATSRFIPQVAQRFEEAESSFLEIRASSSDMSRYLIAEMQLSATSIIKDNPSIQEEIGTEISRVADGM
jgi:Cdc6-like AAA superfamily ATPase